MHNSEGSLIFELIIQNNTFHLRNEIFGAPLTTAIYEFTPALSTNEVDSLGRNMSSAGWTG